MVRIHKRGKDPFLTPKNIQDGDLATIVEPPYVQSAEKSKFGKERTIIPVKLERTGSIYRWGLNTRSNDRLVEKFGEEGDLWVGKQVRIQKRSENVRGEDRDVLYAVPSEQSQIPSA